MSVVKMNHPIVLPTSSPFGIWDGKNYEVLDAPISVLRMAAGEAIRRLTEEESETDRGSCFMLKESVPGVLGYPSRRCPYESSKYLDTEVSRHYTAFTGAHVYSTGFFGVGMASMTKKKRREYRLEMLYYFWMAHQDM